MAEKNATLENVLDLINENLAHINQASFILKTVNNHLRQQIICLLLINEKHSAGELSAELKVKQPIVSQNLAILRKAKLLTARRENKILFHSVNEKYLNEMMVLIEQVAKNVKLNGNILPEERPAMLLEPNSR